MIRIEIQPSAVSDAGDAASWYEAQQVGLGLEFIKELDSAIGRAAGTPEAYVDQFDGVRRVLLKRFPYAVYYLFESETVEVIAILHQHQSPSAWRARIGN